ncbi:MAG: ketosynthase [Lysobacteraceae bacterium]|nr:MAG: ketosynthase [Xanthomonadaceae bacterium]
MIAALRLLLLPAYLVLAHLAGSRHSPPLAALALGDLTLLLLLGPLSRCKLWAWAALIAAVGALWPLAHSTYALLPLLLVPVLFVAVIAFWFARSLRRGRIPLVTRMVAAIYATPVDALSPLHRDYARRLTLAWALLLATLAVADFVLALIVEPDGLLAAFGAASTFRITHAQWSFITNVANYGLIGAFMLIEFQLRKRVFTQRPYRNFAEFIRRMVALGPSFWRELLH